MKSIGKHEIHKIIWYLDRQMESLQKNICFFYPETLSTRTQINDR